MTSFFSPVILWLSGVPPGKLPVCSHEAEIHSEIIYDQSPLHSSTQATRRRGYDDCHGIPRYYALTNSTITRGSPSTEGDLYCF